MGRHDCCTNCTFFYVSSKSKYHPENTYIFATKRARLFLTLKMFVANTQIKTQNGMTHGNCSASMKGNKDENMKGGADMRGEEE